MMLTYASPLLTPHSGHSHSCGILSTNRTGYCVVNDQRLSYQVSHTAKIVLHTFLPFHSFLIFQNDSNILAWKSQGQSPDPTQGYGCTRLPHGLPPRREGGHIPKLHTGVTTSIHAQGENCTVCMLQTVLTVHTQPLYTPGL